MGYYLRKCKHCPLQPKTLFWNCLHLIPLPKIKTGVVFFFLPLQLLVSVSIRYGFVWIQRVTVSALPVGWFTEHFRTWDCFLFPLLAGRWLWRPALSFSSLSREGFLLGLSMSHCPCIADHPRKQPRALHSTALLLSDERDKIGLDRFVGSLDPGCLEKNLRCQ